MTARTWLYGRLTSYTPLTNLIGGANPRVFAKKSMTSSVEQHPYIVFKLGYSANVDLSEVSDLERQFIQVWVHDYADQDVADYTKIDEVIVEVKAALTNQSSGTDGVFTVRYLETSQDLDDETLNTVFKYVRFQIIKEGQNNG